MSGIFAVSIILLSILGLFIFLALILSIFIIKQQTAGVIERFGKFLRIVEPGLGIKIPFADRMVGRLSLRSQQLDVDVDTKTEDNVFVQIRVSVQYNVYPDKVYQAFYMLSNPEEQIKAYVFDVVRARVPEMVLDNVFVKKDDIAVSVKQELTSTMDEFGFQIRKALVNDIIPDPKVRDSMNEINAAQRLRVAAKEKAEAEKIMRVKAAEAEAESKKLQGEGIANQRRAIASGLQDSVDTLKGATGVSPNEVMKMVLMTQYLDTLAQMTASARTNTILLPHSPGGMKSFEDQMQSALFTTAALQADLMETQGDGGSKPTPSN